MAYRTPRRPVDGASPAWPYETLPKQIATDGPLKMGMSGDGSMVIWPSDKPFPERLGLIEAFRGTEEQLSRFHIAFCMQGYETDPRHEHQDGKVWLFNWISGTLAQVYIAGQMAKQLFDGDVDAAWALGHSFEDRLRAVEQASAGS